MPRAIYCLVEVGGSAAASPLLRLPPAGWACMPPYSLVVRPTYCEHFRKLFRRWISGRSRRLKRQYSKTSTPEEFVGSFSAAAPCHWNSPLAGEIGPELAAALSRSPKRLLAATPQGWLRRIDSAGAVSAAPFDLADKVLPYLGAMVLSFEDILESSADFSSGQNEALESLENRHAGHTVLSRWSEEVPLIAVTRGAAGAVLYQRGELPREFPGYPAHEVDPTGAGDVFAAAFLVQLYKTGNADAAMDFANRVAACSIESVGVGGIPTYATAVSRFGRSNIGW
jgi:hypothetical protein